jgi:hypothetical protein
MNKIKCIIKENVTRNSVTEADIHIAKITGEKTKIKTNTRYQDTKTGEEYLCLSGGFGWPEISKPGFALVVAVQETVDGVRYNCLAELEEKNLNSLIRGAWDLYLQYGLNCGRIPWAWYGNAIDTRMSFLYRFNRQHPWSKKLFFLQLPPHFHEPDRAKAYAQVIWNELQREKNRLNLKSCPKLLGNLSTVNPADPKKVFDDNPSVTALGFVLSALDENKPWLRNDDEGRYFGFETDYYEEQDPYDLLHEMGSIRSKKHINTMPWEDGLIPTV